MGHANIPATWTLCCCSNCTSESTWAGRQLSLSLSTILLVMTVCAGILMCTTQTLLCRHMVWCRENTSAPPHSIWESKHEQKGQSKQTWLLPAATQHSCDHFKWVLMNKFAGLKKKKRLQGRRSFKNNKRDYFLSPLQGQDCNIICFAAFEHESLHPAGPYSPALSFKHILSNLCNCTMTGAIPHPHQSLLWRYGLLPHMTTPTLPPLCPPCSASVFYGYSDK